MSVAEHKERGRKSIRCYVITVSDTRDEKSDTSGHAIQTLLGAEGHHISGYRIVRDEPAAIEALLEEALSDPQVDAVIVNGGTGNLHAVMLPGMSNLLPVTRSLVPSEWSVRD